MLFFWKDGLDEAHLASFLGAILLPVVPKFMWKQQLHVWCINLLPSPYTENYISHSIQTTSH